MGQMSSQERIQSLLKEAELYQNQGLLMQSKETYGKVLEIMGENGHNGNFEELVDRVKNKIQAVESHLSEMSQEGEAPKLSKDDQKLIRKLFTFSSIKETAAIEGAMALAEFGQHEEALAEFRRLLADGCLPLTAAKNILRCLLALSSPDAAIEQFKQWVSEHTLSKPDLVHLRTFLGDVLEERGIKAGLPELDRAPFELDSLEEKCEDPLCISSVVVHLDNGLCKVNPLEFEAMFHSDRVISIMVSAKQKNLVDALRPGRRLSHIECYSPMGLFRSSGKVSAKRKIKDGPKQGDYVLDITIDGS
jgi:tetratricopeptide (TPR) repeat protein